jgi:hypothetical protein
MVPAGSAFCPAVDYPGAFDAVRRRPSPWTVALGRPSCLSGSATSSCIPTNRDALMRVGEDLTIEFRSNVESEAYKTS